MVSLTGHEAGNGGYTQGDTYRDVHTSPTRRPIWEYPPGAMGKLSYFSLEE
jgi:hypothetical protein